MNRNSINIILKAEKENKAEKKPHQHKKKSVIENHLANDKMHFASVFISRTFL